MWKKRILPLLCALALLAGLLPGRVQAAQTKPVRYLTVTGTPAQLETGRRLPQATPELASDAGAALHLTQVRWYNSITALQQGDPLPDGASVFGTGAYYLGLELKADDGWALWQTARSKNSCKITANCARSALHSGARYSAPPCGMPLRIPWQTAQAKASRAQSATAAVSAKPRRLSAPTVLQPCNAA